MAFLIGGANSAADTGYNVDNSLRFNTASDDSLQLTPGSAGSTTTWTFSAWVKRTNPGTAQQILSAGPRSGSNVEDQLYFLGADNINWYDGTSNVHIRKTNALFRDPSAWYHLVFVYNSTSGTAQERARIYVNGSEVTSWATNATHAQNAVSKINDTGQHRIGAVGTVAGEEFAGYMSEICFIDGTALAASSFGEFDEDSPTIWKPKDVSGLTFGDEGYYLQFKASGTDQDASGMGADTSGNTNHWSVNNLTAVDQATDSPTNNFCTFNSIVNAAACNLTLSEGNLKVTSGDNNWNSAIGTFALNSGKWYWEVKIVNATYNYNHGVFSLDTGDINDTTNPMNQTGYSGFYNFDGGETRIDDTVSTSDFGTFSADDILGFYLNCDDDQFTIYKNGSSLVSATSLGNGKTDLVPIAVHYNGGVSEYNFGNPTFSISSGNSDANGYGNFEYAVASGYLALCTKNLGSTGG